MARGVYLSPTLVTSPESLIVNHESPNPAPDSRRILHPIRGFEDS